MPRAFPAVLLTVAALAQLALAQPQPAPAPVPTPPAPPAAPAAAPPAAETTLTIGDFAPELSIAKWVKGSPISKFEKGKVYVVEFWATWCGPCKAAMPHLSELQKQYADRGVTIIGVTSADRKGNTQEKVEEMAASKGDAMAYTVAWDNARTTNAAYMGAAMQMYIPTAFVVDRDTRIAWVGFPDELDTVLAEVVAGKWDIDAAKSEFETRMVPVRAQVKFHRAIEAKDAAGIVAHGPAVIKSYGDDAQGLNQLAWSLVDPEAKFDFKAHPEVADIALQAARKADELTDNENPEIIDTLARAYFIKGEKAKAIELQTKAVKLASGDSKEQLQQALDEYKKAD